MEATQTYLDVKTVLRKKQAFNILMPLVAILYLLYVAVDFNVAKVFSEARTDNAKILVADAYSYKTHVTMDNRSGEFRIAIEGEKKGEYPKGESPDWVSLGSTTSVDLEDGYRVTFIGKEMNFEIPGYGTVKALPTRRGVQTTLPDGIAQPEWINLSKNRLAITTPNGRVMVTRNKTDVFRYFFGWELFWFTLDSPFYGKSFGELVSLSMSDQQMVDGQSNFNAMFHDFWHNPIWRHGEVAWALVETLLMAFLGTMGAALIALPLAFLAAKNFTPSRIARFGFRRFFDFVRGVDGLIWTIVLSRAFGPGPLTGALAMLITDTGSFGKIFSEALENVDNKQIEGVKSTGASKLGQYRFGVIPQVMPILLSQVLYFLESNTRSATVIGAIVGGGIGLLLTQAIITQKDWEEVTYYMILIVLLVILMDVLSGWLRSRLIKGKQ